MFFLSGLLSAVIIVALAIVPAIDLLLQGTPEWAAMSVERYAQGKARGRPHCTAPDGWTTTSSSNCSTPTAAHHAA